MDEKSRHGFYVLNTEFKVRYQRNPISSISTRLKRTSGITEKLMKLNKPVTLESIEENIHDVAGIRVICSYIDDIYTIADQRRDMKVEVQIRTIAMDFWASLEHQLKYKQEITEQEQIIAQLKACAEVINTTDAKMLDIRKQIEEMADTPTEEDLLFEKFRRLDMPIE